MKVIILFKDINELPMVIHNHDVNFKIFDKAVPDVLIVNDVVLGYEEHLETWNLDYENILVKDLDIIKLLYQYEKYAESSGDANYIIQFPDEYSLIDDDILENLNPTIIPKQLKRLNEETYYLINPSIFEQIDKGMIVRAGKIKIIKKRNIYFVENKKIYTKTHKIIDQLKKHVEIRNVIFITEMTNCSRRCC